jgi:hypothetical protein
MKKGAFIVKTKTGIIISILILLFILTAVLQGKNNEQVVGNINSYKYHRLNCRWVSKINDNNAVLFKNSKDAEINRFSPCRLCNPE